MNSPRRLKLDYVAAPYRGASLSGIALLALGAAALGSAVALYQQERDRAARLEAELALLGAQRRVDEPAARNPRKAEAIVRANAVAYELARRWDRVFLAIESAGARDVALLAIQPDPRRGLVRITAEAKGKGEMLDYVARLQAAQPLQRVLLDEHEVMAQAPEKPVRFVVSAEWEGPR